MKVKNLEFDSIIYVLKMQISGIMKMDFTYYCCWR